MDPPVTGAATPWPYDAQPPLFDASLLDPELIARQILDFRQMAAFARDPFVVVGGDGVTVTDHEGKAYLDGLSGVFVASVGHGNEHVIQAIHEQLDRLAFAPPLHGTNPPALALARELLDFAPVLAVYSIRTRILALSGSDCQKIRADGVYGQDR